MFVSLSSYSLLPIVNVCWSTIWRNRVLVIVYDIRGLASFFCVVRVSWQCNYIARNLRDCQSLEDRGVQNDHAWHRSKVTHESVLVHKEKSKNMSRESFRSWPYNDLFNGGTAKVTFTNSDTSNATSITLSVKDDQGKTIVDHVSVTNGSPYAIDALRLELKATYSLHLKKEGASDQDVA
jgi:hypothetical protein